MDSLVTIDSLYGDLLVLKGAILGRNILRPAALRQIWRERLRPFWRLVPELYEGIASRFAAQGENFLVIEVAAESRRFFGEQPSLLFLEALAAARSGSPWRCREILVSRPDVLAQVADAPALLARTFKDAWKATGDPRFLEQSFDYYHRAYLDSRGNVFPGVNAAAMALLAGKAETARTLAGEVLGSLDSPVAEDYWTAVTRAECLLILGEVSRSREQYRLACAVSEIPRANLVTTRAQARLLLPCHACGARDFDEVFPLPNIACFSGHRIDAPGRTPARFPASAVRAVAARIGEILRGYRIEIGYCSASQGGDLIFAEVVRGLPGGETRIFLPGGREDFRRTSVSVEGDSSWDARFDTALAEADEITELELSGSGGPGPEDFDYANRACLGAAMMRARELDCELKLIALWDGLAGPKGGTSEMVGLSVRAGVSVEVIDPIRPEAQPRAATTASDPVDTGQLFSIVVFREAGGAIPAEPARARWLLWEDPFFTVIFRSAADAAAFAAEIAGAHGSKAALHFGPVSLIVNPLTGEEAPGGIHLKRTRELLASCPDGRVCASAEFAAVARLEGFPGDFEYLGRLSPACGGPERQVFQLAPEPL